MGHSRALKLLLKRGALIAAANWPVVLVQFVADAVFNALLAVPVAGGVLLVMLLVGAEPAELMRLPYREIIPALIGALLAQPVALVAFLGALGLVAAGGSVLMFAIKAGTLTVMVAGERAAGAIESPPLRVSALVRASQCSRAISSSARCWPRPTRWPSAPTSSSSSALPSVTSTPP
jgi:hypothetical protein